MKNLYLLLLLAFLCLNVKAQQFNPTNGPTSGMETSKFVFIEGDLMYTGYDYHLLRSNDGGKTWNIVTANFTDIKILPTSMIRKGDYLFLTSFLVGRCYRSNNNGDSWEIINSGLPTTYGYQSSSPNSIEISGDNLIMSSMQFPAISTDMGLSWKRMDAIKEWMTDGLNQLPSGLYISSQGTGTPFPPQYIYKSLDHGVTWETLASVPSIPSPGIAMPQGSSTFAELNGYIYSSTTLNGYGLMRSNNNGATWENVGASYNFNTGTCVRNYDGILYFTDMLGAYRSTDEGVTWDKIIDASYFMGDGAGFIARGNGKIWITTGKGPISYTEATGDISAPVIANASLIGMKAGNGVILGVESGKLYSSTNNGYSWSNLNANIGEGNDVLSFSVDGNNWYALATKSAVITLSKSSDKGQSWTAINTTPGGGSAFFSSGSQFYAKGKGPDLKIYKSNDAGATWNEKTVTVLGGALDLTAEVQGFEKHGTMIFADIKNGFAFSSDGGETWTARKFNADGKVVGWPNKFIRLQDNGSGFQIQQSTDNGATWTLTTDGFPILANVIQYANGLGMVNGRVYVLNGMGSAGISQNPGYYFYLEQGTTTWKVAANLGQIPYSVISIDGTAENDLYVSTGEHGVWTNAANNTGIEDTKGSDSFLSVYPNPAKELIQVDCDINSGLIAIMDLTGKVMLTTPFANRKQEVNVSGLRTGMYIINIDGAGKSYRSKLIKR